MPRKMNGIKFGGNSLPGAQTIGRKMAQQFNLRGGLANAVDISAQNPNEWLNATNARMPIIGPSLLGGITNIPRPSSFFNANFYNPSNLSYNTQPRDNCIASLEIGVAFPNDTVVYTGTGTGSSVSNISVGDNCIQLSLTASQNITATITTSSKNLSSPSRLPATQNILAVDTVWSGSANFSSGFIRVGTDSSNYWQWTISSPGDIVTILKFNWNSPNSTVGGPDITNLKYVAISLTATAGGALSVRFSNVRVSSFSSSLLNNTNYQALSCNIQNVFPFVIDSKAQLVKTIVVCNNNIYIENGNIGIYVLTTYPPQLNNFSISALKTGFTQPLPAPAGNFNPAFNFSTFQKTGTSNQNILYYTNGNDGIFSYDPNLALGSRHSQISAIAFKGLASHKNYMWYWGDPSNPNTITPSILSTPGTLDTANAITLNNQDGQNIIVGIISMDDYLVIFRTKDIWIMLGTTTGVGGDILIRKTNSTIGAIHQKAITKIGQIVYFSNGRQVYEFNGNDSIVISEKIKLNSGYFDPQSISLTYNSEEDSLWVMGSSSGDPSNPDPITSAFYPTSGAYVFNPKFKNWTFIGGVADATSVYLGGFSFVSPINNQNYFYTYGLYINYFDSIITPSFPSSWSQGFLVQSSWNNLGSPFIEKYPDKVRLFITASMSNITATFNFRADYSSTITYTTTFIVPSTTGFVDLTIGPGSQGHSFSIEVQVPNNNLAPSGIIDFSGYAISWTETEVI